MVSIITLVLFLINRLLRCIEIISDQSVKNCLNKWRHETKKSKHSDLLLFDKIEYRKLKQKRQLLNVWRECFGRRAQMRKLLNRYEFELTMIFEKNRYSLRKLIYAE